MHIAGTDNLGRDTLSRIMEGSRYSLTAAFCTVLLSSLIGTAIGIAAGYKGGAVDYIVMRLTDAISAFPGILVALVILSILPPIEGHKAEGGQYAMVLALCVMFIPSYIRIVRVEVSSLRGRDYIRRCRVMGANTLRVCALHILPALLPALIPAVIVGMSNALLAECALSFLGLGINPPLPSWGRMMSDAGECILSAPWYAFTTGAVISVTVASFNCIGSALKKQLVLGR